LDNTFIHLSFVIDPVLLSFPTRRSSDLGLLAGNDAAGRGVRGGAHGWSGLLEIGIRAGHICGIARRQATTRPSGVTNDTTVRLRDRKSTRLNSSHVSISYAVFC